MDVDIDNITIKTSTLYFGSVNGLSDKNIQHEPYLSSSRSGMVVLPIIRGKNY